MYQLFLSLIVVGGILFFTVLAFYNRKHLHRKNKTRNSISRIETENRNDPSAFLYQIKNRELLEKQNIEYNSDKAFIKGRNRYIPVIRIEEPIPGLGSRDLIHYLGSGALYTIETAQEPKELVIKEEELSPVGVGKLLLSSKFILVYDNGFKKRILLSSIDKHHFQHYFLIFKRKRVKKRVDVLKIDDRPVEFQYIFYTLI
ncbi:MAG: hypothetical protein ACUVWJ_00100 [Spirochaetota bacterium]